MSPPYRVQLYSNSIPWPLDSQLFFEGTAWVQILGTRVFAKLLLQTTLVLPHLLFTFGSPRRPHPQPHPHTPLF